MAVVIETTIGDFTVDLYVDSRPQACKNFLKLCKMKYYNFCLFHSIQPNFLAQTGDPTGSGSGGESVYGMLYGENARYFEAETMPKLKHNKPGLLSMVNCGNNMLGSQFFITLGEELISLDGEHCVFGEITEGAEIVLKLNDAICDTQYRPYKDIRITHTIILEDPFDDPSGLIVPDMSPEATQERLANGRIGADEEVDETQGLTAEQVEELRQEREAKARATILEIVGDLPDAEMAPPENVLFVCKLNPVTTDDDLEIIFSRFGKVKSCEVIRDKNTGDSLQYAFVEFEEQKSCEDAYFKMDNVLIDDRRIHVDFSQSVAKMRWKGKGRGVEYFDGKEQVKESRSSGTKDREGSRPKVERSSRRERDRDYEERERRRDKGRDREDRSLEKERERGRDSDDRHRRRDDRERSRSDWRKKDKRDYREDSKRYDKRKEVESSRKREDDSKRVSSSSSSRRGEEKKLDKRLDEKKIDAKDSRFLNGKSSSRKADSDKVEGVDKNLIKSEKQETLDKDESKGSKYNTPSHASIKEEAMSDSHNESVEMSVQGAESEKGSVLSASKDVSESDLKTNHVSSRRSSKDDKKQSESSRQDFENDRCSEGRSSLKDEKKMSLSKSSQDKEKKKSLKRKRKDSETRKKKRRRHSSSSDSSSDSSDSSDSSSSSDSSDCKHSKKKKLIVAKKYYRGGKLVKEVKKKKRTKDTSDSESDSEESSDSDSNRKYKSKKRKGSNSSKQGKKKAVHSSEDSPSESSSSEDSDENTKKRRKKTSDKHFKKKSKHSKKSRRRKRYSSSSSDSEDSKKSKTYTKKQKKVKNSKLSTNLVTTTSE